MFSVVMNEIPDGHHQWAQYKPADCALLVVISASQAYPVWPLLSNTFQTCNVS